MRKSKAGHSTPGTSTSSTTPQPSPTAPSPVESSKSPESKISSIPDLLKELQTLIKESKVERDKCEPNLNNIAKTHEKMRAEQKMTQYYKTKLKGLYQAAMLDAENEAAKLREALNKLIQIKDIRNEQRLQARNMTAFGDPDGPRKIMRRGVLMNMLQQAATTLPLFIGKLGERPPPLCGAIQAEASYISKPGDLVAARVKDREGDENWILAEVTTFNSTTHKYEVVDIDEEGKEKHSLSKRKIISLPLMRANPETDVDALFAKGALVMALYPQTTCFYRGLVDDPPLKPTEEYSVLFEDNSYADGYSPALRVAQRYVVQVRENKVNKRR